jgi:hypothetical protein
MTADQANSIAADAGAAARKPFRQELLPAWASCPGFDSKVAPKPEPGVDLADASRAEPSVLGLDRQSDETASRFERPAGAFRGNLPRRLAAGGGRPRPVSSNAIGSI